MKNRMRAAVLVAAAVCGGVAPLVVAGPASAATPTCNIVTWWQDEYVPAEQVGAISPSCLMSRGAVSDSVRQLQRSLNMCYSAGISADRQFGPATESALRRVQTRLGITSDGKYGPQTARAMKHEPGAHAGTCGYITF